MKINIVIDAPDLEDVVNWTPRITIYEDGREQVPIAYEMPLAEALDYLTQYLQRRIEG